MWSFYFLLLEFLGELLPWKKPATKTMDQVRDEKKICLCDPEKFLWVSSTRNMFGIKQIFTSINALRYEDRPDYEYIKEMLKYELEKECENYKLEDGINSYSTSMGEISAPQLESSTNKRIEELNKKDNEKETCEGKNCIKGPLMVINFDDILAIKPVEERKTTEKPGSPQNKQAIISVSSNWNLEHKKNASQIQINNSPRFAIEVDKEYYSRLYARGVY